MVDREENVMLASLDQIAEAYELDPEPGSTIVGQGTTYREIRLDGWPDNLHYERSEERRVG